MKKLWVVGSIFLALLLIVTGILFVNAKNRTLHGAVITPPFAVAEIHLTDQNGQHFTMSSLRGKVVLLYFGYTNCQDECPLTMAHLKLAVDSLGGNSKDVQVIMVTTDPERDTQQALKDWLGKFDPGFIGLYGTPDELAKVWSDYGVAVEDGGETHSDFTFVIDRSGNLRETFLPDSLPAEEAADTSLLLSGY